MERTLETDVCVVGAGPAGLALAVELVGHGLDVLVLESGSERPDASVQALNEGDVLGDPYAGLAATRHRGIGGTAGIWNTAVHGSTSAKCVPLDPIDFEERPGREWTGWPFSDRDLAPFYERALALCGLKQGSFEALGRESAGRRPPPALPGPIVPAIYQMTTRDELLRRTAATVGASDSGMIRTGATVIRLATDQAGDEVVEAVFGAPGAGAESRVRARRFVLAAGAVENARLLLSSKIGNEYDLVGRCFMEHPRDTSILLRPRTSKFYRDAGYYDLHDADDGTPVLGRLGIDPEALRVHGLPNASGTLLPAVRGGVYRARRLLGPLATTGLAGRLLPRGGHGWSTRPAPGLAFDGLTLLLNLEQAAHPDNRIRLGAASDSLGMPRAQLHWRWRVHDQERLERMRGLLVDALRSCGLFGVSVDPNATVDPNAHHHAGTTRMHEDPRRGVVNADLRVYGTRNLYVAGASAFPTAGFANPLLTILALSARLAAHLARET